MNSKTLIIAEAGVNHNGDIGIAKKLVDVAAEAGADVVKFQTFKAKNLVSKSAVKADYQKSNTDNNDDSQLKMLEALELDNEAHFRLNDYCNEKGIKFLSTPFDLESLQFLMKMGMDTIKIPSGEITNLPLLESVASFNKKVILSTGMSTLEEIIEAVKVLIDGETRREEITVLHCNTEYPTPFEDVNLKAIKTIQDAVGVQVGYSDHTLGIEIPIAAVSLGATIIEKHFTLSREMGGPDHRASLEPHELSEMVKCIRNIENGMGHGNKVPSPSEKKNMEIARKSIHYGKDLNLGHKIESDDLVMKRPGNGISPMLYKSFVGKVLNKEVGEDDMLNNQDFV